jgi:hypothetical protein
MDGSPVWMGYRQSLRPSPDIGPREHKITNRRQKTAPSPSEPITTEGASIANIYRIKDYRVQGRKEVMNHRRLHYSVLS